MIMGTKFAFLGQSAEISNISTYKKIVTLRYCCLELRNGGKHAQWSILVAILVSFRLYLGVSVMNTGKSG